VIDDDSTDNTSEIIDKYKNKKLKYLIIPHSGIPAKVRNYGISKAQGKYIAFLDADDAWYPKKIEEQLKHFQEKELVGVGTDAIIISDTPYYRQLDFGKSKKGFNDYDYNSIISANPIKTSSVIVEKNIIEKVEGFDENPKFKYIEDYELWLRIAQLGKFRILGKKLIFYRMHYDQSRKNIGIAINTMEIFKKHVRLGYLRDQKMINEAEATVSLSIGYNYLFSDGHEGKDYYLKAYKQSSKYGRKIKSLVGYLLSILPRMIRKPANYLLHKIDRAVAFSREII
jgi:glycosyltransferase involved in cell wall biosynthesis